MPTITTERGEEISVSLRLIEVYRYLRHANTHRHLHPRPVGGRLQQRHRRNGCRSSIPGKLFSVPIWR
jgi:hypothetical protein